MNTIADVAWYVDNRAYQAEFEQENLVHMILFWDDENAPTGIELIDCIGAPSYYQAYYVYNQFEISLFYPEQGFIIQAAQATMFDRTPDNISDIPMYTAIFVRPGSLESIIKDAYPNNEGYLQFVLENGHVWSGDWNNIKYISD